MSDNKQKETPNGYDLDGYEQLKRRNRRRLVLAPAWWWLQVCCSAWR